MTWIQHATCGGRIALLGTLVAMGSTIAGAEEPTSAEVFAQRIMPIFQSPEPSSCIQCHLSSVDLKEYIRPSSEETFLALRDQGLIDTANPKESRILQLMLMRESAPDSLAQRIHAKNRKAEFEAFSAWLETCCQDDSLVTMKASNLPEVGPRVPTEVIQHTRKDRLVDSFVRNVWSQRMRCFPCHTPSELDPKNPLHEKPIQRHADFVAKYGARMNLFLETPERSLHALMASSHKTKQDRLPLLNVNAPLHSLLLLKPLAKLPPKNDTGQLSKPSAVLPVSHMGGVKMHAEDQSYKAFAAWLSDYSETMRGSYRDLSSLPQDNWYPTEHVLRVRDVPEAWSAMTTVQLFLHRWNSDLQQFEKDPFAFSQAKVTPRRMINGALFVIAGENSDLDSNGVRLDPCRVQLRVYLDQDQKLATDPTLLLNNQEADGTAGFMARFGQGFKGADIVDGRRIRLTTNDSGQPAD